MRSDRGGRDRKVRVKSGKARSPSSQRWLERQLNDPYVARAKREGLRGRAAFKLMEIDDKYRLLRVGARVVDLGAAPGGWSQVAAQRVGAQEGRGLVIAIDILPMAPVPGVQFAPPAEEPPVPTVLLEVPPPALVPPVPTVLLDCAFTERAVPARRAAASAALFRIFIFISSLLDCFRRVAVEAGQGTYESTCCSGVGTSVLAGSDLCPGPHKSARTAP